LQSVPTQISVMFLSINKLCDTTHAKEICILMGLHCVRYRDNGYSGSRKLTNR
jgi:hypothetical protein